MTNQEIEQFVQVCINALIAYTCVSIAGMALMAWLGYRWRNPND